MTVMSRYSICPPVRRRCCCRPHTQRELEALFDRYDEDGSGTLNYHEFARALTGQGALQPAAAATVSAVDRVRTRLFVVTSARICCARIRVVLVASHMAVFVVSVSVHYLIN